MVRPLRHRVLRPGRPESTVHTPRDEDRGTWHLAAFDGDRVVGVVTLFTEPFGDDLRSAERFRWMAVDAGSRRRGAGAALMRHAAARLDERGTELMWAHGRDSALEFYLRLGFRVVGDGYVDPDTGIGHHLIVIDVPALLP